MPGTSLADGEIELRLGRFALTTNNITYAAFGDAMQYWDFFPTGQPEWGHMPVWGFADVVASAVEGVVPGERFYGYFPIASHVRMQPERVTGRGFYDGAEHRKPLVSAYNQYTRVSQDAAYDPALENYQMLYRPLFITSFMLADFLQDNGCFGARRLVFSSASSKTAYGAAFCLRDADGLTLTALTSAGNRAFVDSLGAYHEAPRMMNWRAYRRTFPPYMWTSPVTRRCGAASTSTSARRWSTIVMPALRKTLTS